MFDISPPLPVVLAVGGHDPGGGAGIQADIESIGANGCHAATALTCLTIQDSCNVSQLIPIAAATLADQISATLTDCQVAVIKVGLIGSLPAAEAIVEVLHRHPSIPVVFDPVLSAGGGSELATERLIQYIRQAVIPLCRLITPNIPEARKLIESKEAPEDDAIGHQLLDLGADAALITGTHEENEGKEITHRLFRTDAPPMRSSCKRLAGEFHGSGCTLASAIAARLAAGETLATAVEQGLEYSWQALTHGYKVGKCQSIPGRLFRNLRQC
ncbi:MAG: hydroxymethylpyrimidine/phosphomethylpyrimidine kinase [Candidatus Thiodiazotropha sp.]|jgi:hydroxymethylpyrimidine/phosphomethylpyrimidine kinase